jgi:aldehyde dehydrogenase (NAD+)
MGPDPKIPTTVYGPVGTPKHFDTVMNYINIGKQEQVPLAGGTRKGKSGFYINPTIFLNPSHSNPVYKEEIFGPVLSITTFVTENEAIDLANDTVTGLSGQ